MEIKNSHFLITGSNRGIGKAVAEMAARDKAHLILVNRSQDPELEKNLLQLGAASVQQHSLDLADSAAISRFIEQHKNHPIDILFNNAGQLTGGLIEEQKIEDIYSMLQVNVNALIHMTHGFLPGMLQRKKGKIINHSSVSGVMPLPSASTYAAAKAAVLMFTRCLAAELKGTGVTSLVLITPGIETRMYNEIPKMYGKNFDLSFLSGGMAASKYARIIREAILEDLRELKPQGMEGLGVLLAQHLPQAFEKVVIQKFKRNQ